MSHAISTYVIVGITLVCIGACVGFVVGVREGPSYYDAMRVEQRLRELVCEQIVKNGVLKQCEVFK